MKRILIMLLSVCLSFPAYAVDEALHPKQPNWPFDGWRGTVDRTAAQRGFQVYKDVCASCHSLQRVAFRNLQNIGFGGAEAKALASSYNVQDGPDDAGEMFERPGRPSDHIPPPYLNDNAARAANGGALPPDLSLIAKARHDGPNYLYSLLTGYGAVGQYVCSNFDAQDKCTDYRLAKDEDRTRFAQEQKKRDELIAQAQKEGKPVPVFNTDKSQPDAIYPCMLAQKGEGANPPAQRRDCHRLGQGMYYNPYFPGMQIAMPPPLAEGQVSYEDGTEATLDQMARDVTVFLQWAAEPEMEHRKAIGIKVMIFLAIATVFFYFAKKRVWSALDS